MAARRSVKLMTPEADEDDDDSDMDVDEEEIRLTAEFEALEVVQRADALLSRLAARLAAERLRQSRARADLNSGWTDEREEDEGEEEEEEEEVEAPSLASAPVGRARGTSISYGADGTVATITHRGRKLSTHILQKDEANEYTLKVRRKPGATLGLVLAFDDRPRAAGVAWHPPIVLEIEPGAIQQPRGAAWSRPSVTLGVPMVRAGDHLLAVNGREASEHATAAALFPPHEVELTLRLSRPVEPAAELAAAVDEMPRRLEGTLWRRCGDYFYRKRDYVLENGVLSYLTPRTAEPVVIGSLAHVREVSRDTEHCEVCLLLQDGRRLRLRADSRSSFRTWSDALLAHKKAADLQVAEDSLRRTQLGEQESRGALSSSSSVVTHELTAADV